MLRLTFSMTMRDWRAGELRLLLLALMVAVASLSSVSFFTERMAAGLNRDAHQWLGADLLVQAEEPIDPAWRAEATRRGLQLADTTELTSMAQAGQGEQASAQLVSLKAVSSGYPLRGALSLREGAGAVVTRQIPAPGTAWADPALLARLNVQVGASLQLGERRFVLAQVLAKEPDRGVAVAAYIPRVMIAASELAATGLTQAGAFAEYRLQVAGEAGAVDAYHGWLKTRIERERRKGVKLDTLGSNRTTLRAGLDRAERFLSLIGLLSTMLAAVAVAMAARRFMLRHVDACAMLRCLGLTQNQVTRLYLLELLAVGVLGGVAGVALGFSGHFVLLELLGGLVTGDLAPASWMPAARGLATGVLLLVGFAVPPILQLRNVPHNRLLRRESEPPQARTVAAYGLGLAVFTGLLLWQAGDVTLGLLTGGGFLAALLLFALCARLAVASLKYLRGALAHSAWRFALTDLQRRPAAAVIQIVALALGLMALLLLTLVRGDLLTSWKNTAPADAPNHVIINIGPDQRTEIAARLQPYGKPELYPQIRARLVGINDKPVKAADFESPLGKRMVEDEIDLSSADAAPASDVITAGHWFGAAAGKAELSVSVGAAEALGVKLGDRLTLEVAGSALRASVTSLRKIDRRSRRTTFSFLLDPAAGAQLPATWVTAVHVPARETQFTNRLTHDYPNLSVLDIGALIAQFQAILEQVAAAIEFLFLFTLVAGVLVLYATLAGSQDERMRQAAVLRMLGATRAQLSQAQWIEHGLIGALAGVLAAAGASATSWALARFVFKLDWHFAPLLWPAGLVAGALCAVIGAWTGLRAVLNRPPLQSLRAD
jgi:putative ABC transport system permease protein